VNGLVLADRIPHRARKRLYARHERVAQHFPIDWPVSPSTKQ
jgi:peptide deformylase